MSRPDRQRATQARQQVSTAEPAGVSADIHAAAFPQAEGGVDTVDIHGVHAGAEQLRARLAAVELAGRRLSLALWGDLLGLMVMTAAGVTGFALDHGVPVQVAWMADPLAGAALVICLQGDAVLARHRVRPSGWAVAVRLLAGAGTWAMNTWQSWSAQDAAGVVLHSIFPALLIGLSEAVSYYRRQFGAIAGDLRRQLGALAEAAQAEQLAEVDAEAEAAQTARDLALAQAEAERAAALARAEAERTEQARLAAEAQRLQTAAEAHQAQVRLAEIQAAEARRQDQARERDQRRERAAGALSAQPARSPATAHLVSVNAHRSPQPTAHPVDPDALMRAHWDSEVSAGRVPTGADLARAGGVSPATGRRRRQDWETELPAHLREEQSA